MKSADHIIRSKHGGSCCGMTHISGIGNAWSTIAPTALLAERVPDTAAKWFARVDRTPALSLRYNEAYPQQTAEDRVAEMIGRITDGIPWGFDPEIMTGQRPKGIIEIVLVDNQLDAGKDHGYSWREALAKLGFKEVNSGKNSNSGNRIHVFHFNTGE